MSGTDLLSALHTVVNSGTLSFSYDWSRFEAADEDPENSSNVIMIYARTSVKKTAHVSGSKGTDLCWQSNVSAFEYAI